MAKTKKEKNIKKQATQMTVYTLKHKDAKKRSNLGFPRVHSNGQTLM